MSRKDFAAHLTHLVCRALGHKWVTWPRTDARRCTRCLAWESGRSPMEERANG